MKNKKILVCGLIILILIVFLIVLKNKIQRIFYPKLHEEFVSMYSDEYGVDENLVFAVIKAESNFQEDAVSHKDALGLMQIMKETAEDVARKYNIEIDFNNSEREILNVQNNIKIGTKYLAVLLEKYKNIEYKNEVISEIKNLFQEIIRLANFKLLDKGYWTKIYSSSTSYEEVKETGKLYVSIDNAYLYQFACLLFTNCLKNGIYNYEFKVNNDQEINRTDNLVIYFTEDNLNSYLSIINELKQTYPEFNFNYSHILGKELSDGVAIAKDYKDGSSFTEKICSTILELRKKGYDAETIVNSIEGSIDTHLESVTTLISDEQQLIEDRKR